MNDLLTIICGDALEVLKTLPDESVNCCVTSPPYFGLRDYKAAGQIGLEKSPEEYVARMVAVFREVRRVLRDDGTLWLNLGDSYCSTAPGTMGDKLNQRGILAGVSDRRAEGSRKTRPNTPVGCKPKDLIGIPWLTALALRNDGWYLRQDIIWSKPNPMPESVLDRCTKSHEYIFLLSKSATYHYNAAAIAEPLAYGSIARLEQDVENQIGSDRVPGKTNGNMKAVSRASWKARIVDRILSGDITTRNKRSVWTVTTQPFKEAHFATFPPEIPKLCILAGCPVGGTVLDPFFGSGTTGMVALDLGRKIIGIELNPEYVEIAKTRCFVTPGLKLH